MTSRLGELYEHVYDRVAGRHPYQRFWHFQWLAIKDLRRDLRRIFASISGGTVLDVGCGEGPYRSMLPRSVKYVGLDIEGGGAVAELIVEPGQRWLLDDHSIDVVLCTQVLEHTLDPRRVITEMARVLRPGGMLIVTAPFAYNEHGRPHDYWRFTINGLVTLLGERWEILEKTRQGGIGSTCGILLLNWLDESLNLMRALRMLRGVLLPLWLVVASMINIAGWVLDRIDRTGAAYGNVIIVARKFR